jgi:hypothetical protein
MSREDAEAAAILAEDHPQYEVAKSYRTTLNSLRRAWTYYGIEPSR